MQVAEANPAPPVRAATRVRPLTLRLVLALALFPIVPGSTLLLTRLLEACWTAQPGWYNELQAWAIFGTVAFVLLSIWIWRALVVWTAGRYAGTVLVAAIPLAQVLWWKPLWQAGCIDEDILRGAQTLGAGALWAWMTIWVWWGWSRLGPSLGRRLRMSPSAKRVLLSFATIPLVVAVYAMSIVAFSDTVSDREEDSELVYGALLWCGGVVALLGIIWIALLRARAGRRVGALLGALLLAVIAKCVLGVHEVRRDEMGQFGISGLLAAGVAVAAWLLIWRSCVIWDVRSRSITALGAVVFMGFAVVAPVLLLDSPLPDWVQILAITLPLSAWGAWMITTLLFWRFHPVVLPGRIDDCLRCRSCGYSLRGLYATRCPECGAQPTLDELLAAVCAADDA